MMKIHQSRIFENKIKKLSKQEKGLLDVEINKIAKNPLLGEEKKGDLRGVFVYKFKIKSLQYLLSYRMIKSDLELIMLGPHENYYRDLKGYLKQE
jgi:mRNA interferase RelE/StbE